MHTTTTPSPLPQVEWDTDPGRQEVQAITTSTFIGANEVQVITTSAPRINAVQTVRTSASTVYEVQVGKKQNAS